MTRDHAEELMNIEASRIERERWAQILTDAGEHDLAEEFSEAAHADERGSEDRSMTAVYINNALAANCLEIMDGWGMSLDKIHCIAADVPGECERCLAAKIAKDEARNEEMRIDQ